MPNYKAVIFDMGGVVMKYRHHEVYLQLMSRVENDEEHRKHWHNFERGHVGLTELSKLTDRFKHIVEKLGENAEHAQVEDFMGEKDGNIAKAIEKLKQHGYKVALLTNNGYCSDKKERSLILQDVSDFDVVVESCRHGHRKPDPEIYHITTTKLEIKPEECIFVDDLLENVNAAQSLGWTAIHLSDGNSELAVRELEKLLNIQIL